MTPQRTEIGVIVERRKLKGPWADVAWRAVAVLPRVPATPPWSPLGEDGDVTRFYAGALELEFFRVDTATYRDNLASGAPKLWVVLAEAEGEPPVMLRSVTADPAEGEALTESGSDKVEMVAMPAEIAERLAAFVAEHHVERQFFKRRRDRADTEALAHRPRGTDGSDER